MGADPVQGEKVKEKDLFKEKKSALVNTEIEGKSTICCQSKIMKNSPELLNSV